MTLGAVVVGLSLLFLYVTPSIMFCADEAVKFPEICIVAEPPVTAVV